MQRRHRLRALANWVNLSTPLGLALARAGGCRPRPGPRHLWLADGYRPRFPLAAAFTVGDVLISRRRWAEHGVAGPLLAHEERHCWQWCLLGPLFLPAYLVATGWSWLRTGDRSSANLFERDAGLVVGGYVERPVVPLRRRFTARSR